MATPLHAVGVKSLNKSPGRRRFVELNTAEDFISFYEKMMPLVQTLPLVLLHKESILSELLSRLQLKARLSLEPILRLTASLSRDLLEDFISFLPRIADSFYSLLKSGADREPEIIEQIFKSWSHILMYLQKYLVKDVVHVLKVTIKLRYYPEWYIQEFMADATSFLLRNAPKEQLRKGVDTVIEVLTATFKRLCEDLEPKELNLMWNCLYNRIDDSVNDEDYRHLSCLLSLLISTVQINNGMKISDYQPMIERVRSFVQKFIVPSSIVVGQDNSEIVDKILQLMLCILDGLKSFNDMSTISSCLLQWTPVFALRNSRPIMEADSHCKSYLPEFETEKAVDALGIFADNLCNSDKAIRVATLRILCHCECHECKMSANDQPPENIMKTEGYQTHPAESHVMVLQLLLSIEATPLSISTSRKVILLISRIQMAISAGKISETYMPILLSGIIGIFYNRFSYLWNPASECLAILIRENVALVWGKFVHYFEECLSTFHSPHNKPDGQSAEVPYNSCDLVERFTSFAAPTSDSTPYATVLSSLLQSLQKIPSVAESRSRQIVPLFLKFLGYNNEDLLSVGSFNSDACKGKEWRGVLKEWLSLFKLMRNPRAFYRSQSLKDVLLIRFMDENDAEIQMRVLDCLLTWKDDFLIPYEQHLRNLISSKNLREELTTWSLSREFSY
ncbi:hypothetical protein GH714_023309 [Hevea brasiliensis]|uniref:U3 small nucleolar RNA-associated protein 20 N-terminal domain-containing protein n=1 Tax=Hevea brasiliensis TaxID=3981 RepID=A0A6A6KJ85_HEVBR|nr:hypothetical protein GH714_023309 [Hevea brasiliensis]